MRIKNYKKGCTKRTMTKSPEVVRTYDWLGLQLADMLEEDPKVKEFRTNVALVDFEAYLTQQGLPNGDYTSDFVIIKQDGTLAVKECIFFKQLLRPKNCKLLDASRNYWRSRGVTDWQLVIDKKGRQETIGKTRSEIKAEREAMKNAERTADKEAKDNDTAEDREGKDSQEG